MFTNLKKVTTIFFINPLLFFVSMCMIVDVKVWGYSSVGRAPALQAGCQRFESAYLH